MNVQNEKCFIRRIFLSYKTTFYLTAKNEFPLKNLLLFERGGTVAPLTAAALRAWTHSALSFSL